MTKLLKRLFALLLFGVVLLAAPHLVGQQGYVLISLGNWTAEGSVVSYLTAMIIAVMLIYALWLCIKYLIVFVILPSKWWRSHHAKTHANYFQAGLDFMALGQWQQAAEQFLRVKRIAKIQSAHELALVCSTRANNEELVKKVNKAVGVSETENTPSLTHLINLKQHNNYRDAFVELNKLNLNLLKQSLPTQQLWLDIQVNNFNWTEVDKHLAKINKQVHKMSDPGTEQEWDEFLFDCFSEAFIHFIADHSVNQLQQHLKTWHKVNLNLKPVASAYIHALAFEKQNAQIEQVIIDNWRANGDAWVLDNIRLCYSTMKRVHMDRLFAVAQKKVTKAQDNKVLLTIYAYLAAGQKDNQLAKQALEQVIYTNNSRQDSILYADVLAELGEIRHSLDVYQQVI